MIFNYDAFKAGMQIPNKKTMEQELAQQIKLLQEKAALEDKALSSGEKEYNLYQRDPASFEKYMMARNPYGDEMAAYKMGMLGLGRNRLGLDQQYKNWQMNNPPMTPLQRNFGFLEENFPDLSEEELLSLLLRGGASKSGSSAGASQSPPTPQSFSLPPGLR